VEIVVRDSGRQDYDGNMNDDAQRLNQHTPSTPAVLRNSNRRISEVVVAICGESPLSRQLPWCRLLCSAVCFGRHDGIGPQVYHALTLNR
jgi:hypothetical protein